VISLIQGWLLRTWGNEGKDTKQEIHGCAM